MFHHPGVGPGNSRLPNCVAELIRNKVGDSLPTVTRGYPEVVEIGPAILLPTDPEGLEGHTTNPDDPPLLFSDRKAKGLVDLRTGKKIGGAIRDKLELLPHDTLPVERNEGLVILLLGVPDTYPRRQSPLLFGPSQHPPIPSPLPAKVLRFFFYHKIEGGSRILALLPSPKTDQEDPKEREESGQTEHPLIAEQVGRLTHPYRTDARAQEQSSTKET